MQSIIRYDGFSSDPFPIKSRVKKGCVRAATLFGIFFSLLLSHAFSLLEDGVYLHTRSDGKLVQPCTSTIKDKVRKALIRKMLFADNAALAAHTEEALQGLLNCFARACNEFGLTVARRPRSWAKTSATSPTSPSVTTLSKWYTLLPTWVPPPAATSLYILS